MDTIEKALLKKQEKSQKRKLSSTEVLDELAERHQVQTQNKPAQETEQYASDHYTSEQHFSDHIAEQENTEQPKQDPVKEALGHFDVSWKNTIGESEEGPLYVLWDLIESYKVDIFDVSFKLCSICQRNVRRLFV